MIVKGGNGDEPESILQVSLRHQASWSQTEHMVHASVQHLEGDSCQSWVDVGVDGVVFGEAEVVNEAVLSSLLLWY